MVNKHFQFLRSAAKHASFDAAKKTLSDKTLFAGEPALAYYTDGDKEKALLAIGGPSGQTYFYNSDKIDELIAAVDGRINGLDFTAAGGDGKVIATISQKDGQVSATTIDLTAANVAYSGKGSILSATTKVNGALEALETAVLNNKAAELTYKTIQLTAEEVTALGEANVKEAYQTVSVDKNGKQTKVGDVIKIYKDSSLSGVTYSGQTLHFTYIKANGDTETVDVPMDELIIESEVEKGIQAVGGKLSIKLDADNEGEFLTVGANGLKLSGVQSAINTSITSSNTYTDNAIAKLDATVTGASRSTYSTVKIDEVGGKLTAVTITDTIGDVSANKAGYAEATNVKAYVDAKVSGKNVSATGDTYVSASASGNTVTVSTNVANLTVDKSGDADSTLAGTAKKLVDGNELATKVSSFVNTRLKEEINKLDVTDTPTTGQFVTSVSENDGKITVTRGNVAASGVTAVEIAAASGVTVAVAGKNVAAQIASLAQSVAVAQEACNIDSTNNAIVVTDGEGKDSHTKIEFKLSTSGATSDMLSIVSDGLKMSDTWDCGTF